MIRKSKIVLLVLSLILTNIDIKAQEPDSITVSSTPYDLLSSYYESEFKPFSKGNWYVGLAFSLDDKSSTNKQGLLQTIVDGNSLDYNLLLKTGYYFNDYGMVGLDFNYYQSKFTGDLLQDQDTIQSNSMSRGYAVTPNIRASIPLTPNERLSFYVGLGLKFGLETANKRNIRYLDEVTKTYTTIYNFGIGVTPGITFFAMENFAVEVGLNVFGYNLSISDIETNGTDQSQVVRQKLNLSLDLLSLELGLAYYFGANN